MLTSVILLSVFSFGFAAAEPLHLKDDCLDGSAIVRGQEQTLSFYSGSVKCYSFPSTSQLRLRNLRLDGPKLRDTSDSSDSLNFYDKEEYLLATFNFNQLPDELTIDFVPRKNVYIWANVSAVAIVMDISFVTQTSIPTTSSIVATFDGNFNPTVISYPHESSAAYPPGVHLHYVLNGSSVCIEEINLPQVGNCKSYVKLQVDSDSIYVTLCPKLDQPSKQPGCVNNWEFNYSPVRIEFYTDSPATTAKYRGVRVKVDGNPPLPLLLLPTTTMMMTETTTTVPNGSTLPYQECPSGAGSEYNGVSIPAAMKTETSNDTCPKYFSPNKTASRCVLNCKECANDLCSDNGYCTYDNMKPEMTCRCTVGCMDGPNCTMAAGCIAAIVIGVILALVLLILCIFLIVRFMRNRRSDDPQPQKDVSAVNPAR